MPFERSKVDFPLWRKKVDSSLFNYKGTTIPTWVCNTWNIQMSFSNCISKTIKDSQVKIILENKIYNGWVTISKEGRVTPAYRLWFSEELLYRIKSVFLMSYMRDIEARLRKETSINIENEIPFWEFLDIEYDSKNKTFYFFAHYTQKPNFPELFKRLIGSPKLHKIDDELENKGLFRIYKQDWKSREELDSELEIENVLYFLIDTKKKLLYIGEASRLVKRLKQEHYGIENWDYYRYDVLPDQISKHRVQFERMLIKDFVELLDNSKGLGRFNISNYRLVNDKID